MGFSYQLEKWNGTYNDLVKYIGDVSNPYTMGLTDTVPTADRWQLVDFTVSYHFASITVLFNAPAVASASGWWGFLAPFDMEVWLVFLTFFIFSAAVLKITKLFPGHGKRGVTTGECLWISFSILFC